MEHPLDRAYFAKLDRDERFELAVEAAEQEIRDALEAGDDIRVGNRLKLSDEDVEIVMEENEVDREAAIEHLSTEYAAQLVEYRQENARQEAAYDRYEARRDYDRYGDC